MPEVFTALDFQTLLQSMKKPDSAFNYGYSREKVRQILTIQYHCQWYVWDGGVLLEVQGSVTYLFLAKLHFGADLVLCLMALK